MAITKIERRERIKKRIRKVVPKTKNTKHIEVLDGFAEKIAEKFVQEKNVFDAEVYSAIRKFKNQ